MVTTPDPLVPPSLFRSREFTVTNLATVLLYAGLGVSFFLVAYGLQVAAGWSATRAGVALLPATAMMLLFSSRSAALSERIGPRLQLTVGPLLAAAGLLLLLRIGPDASWVRHVLPGAVVFGLGLVTFVAPLTATVMGSVDPDQVSTASGVNNAVARTASLAAIAVIPAAVRVDDRDRAGRGHRRRADGPRHRGRARCRRRAVVLHRAGATHGVASVGPPGALRGGRAAAAAGSDSAAPWHDDRVRVTITGAAGRIGRCLVPGLVELGHDVRGIDLHGPTSRGPTRSSSRTSPRTTTRSTRSVSGADAVVHLAANAGETDFPTALASHVVLTHRVLEAARTNGVGRVVYASSNHAVGFTPWQRSLPVETRARPDTFYGMGKAAAEALCSLYHDRHHLAVACLRIGSFHARPGSRRELATWLSPGDAVRLVDACLAAPDLDTRSCTGSPTTGARGGTSGRPGARVPAAGRRRGVRRRDRRRHP